MKTIIGIDPGKDGGISALTVQDDEIVSIDLYKIPRIKTEVDYRKLSNILNDICTEYDNPIFVLEDVHSVFGASASANFQFGHICGVLLGIILGTKKPYHPVNPKIWQKEIWQRVDIVEVSKKDKNGKVKVKTDTKATSLLAASRLFPDTNFLATDRSSKPHDGLIDATLIAEYGRRSFK